MLCEDTARAEGFTSVKLPDARALLRRLLRAIRANWPKTEILLRGDSHYCCPEVLDWCRANGLTYILGVAPTTTLRRHVAGIETSTKQRFDAAPIQGKVRRFKEFYDGAASWSRRVSSAGRWYHTNLTYFIESYLTISIFMPATCAARSNVASNVAKAIPRLNASSK